MVVGEYGSEKTCGGPGDKDQRLKMAEELGESSALKNNKNYYE